jgi:hypothetical protein
MVQILFFKIEIEICNPSKLKSNIPDTVAIYECYYDECNFPVYGRVFYK